MDTCFLGCEEGMVDRCGTCADMGKCCASAYLSWVFTDCLMSRW